MNGDFWSFLSVLSDLQSINQIKPYVSDQPINAEYVPSNESMPKTPVDYVSAIAIMLALNKLQVAIDKIENRVREDIRKLNEIWNPKQTRRISTVNECQHESGNVFCKFPIVFGSFCMHKCLIQFVYSNEIPSNAIFVRSNIQSIILFINKWSSNDTVWL